MDGEVNVSDDSQNYLPTPPNDDDDRMLEDPNFDEQIKGDSEENIKQQYNFSDINEELN